MAEEKPPKKLYRLPLAKDAASWETVRARAKLMVTVGNGTTISANGKPVRLKPDFKVTDSPDSPAPAIGNGWLTIEDKQILSDGQTLEFDIKADPAQKDAIAACKADGGEPQFILNVEVEPIFGAKAQQVMQATLQAAAGMFIPGAAVSPFFSYQAKCKVAVQVPKFFIEKASKPGWADLERTDLQDHLDEATIGRLCQEGGAIGVTFVAKPGQEAENRPIEIPEGIEIKDVEAMMNWAGDQIPGNYAADDKERRKLIFTIPKKAVGGAVPDAGATSSSGGATPTDLDEPLQMEVAPNLRLHLARIRAFVGDLEQVLVNVDLGTETDDYIQMVVKYLGDTFKEVLTKDNQLMLVDKRLGAFVSYVKLQRFFVVMAKKAAELRRKVEDVAIGAVIDTTMNYLMLFVEKQGLKKIVNYEDAARQNLKNLEGEMLDAETKKILQKEADEVLGAYEVEIAEQITKTTRKLETSKEPLKFLDLEKPPLDPTYVPQMKEAVAKSKECIIAEQQAEMLEGIKSRVRNMRANTTEPLAERWAKCFGDKAEVVEEAVLQLADKMHKMRARFDTTLTRWRAGYKKAADEYSEALIRARTSNTYTGAVRKALDAQEAELGLFQTALRQFEHNKELVDTAIKDVELNTKRYATEITMECFENYKGNEIGDAATAALDAAEKQRKLNQGWWEWLWDEAASVAGSVGEFFSNMAEGLVQTIEDSVAVGEKAEGYLGEKKGIPYAVAAGVYFVGSLLYQTLAWIFRQLVTILAWFARHLANLLEGNMRTTFLSKTMTARDAGEKAATDVGGITSDFFFAWGDGTGMLKDLAVELRGQGPQLRDKEAVLARKAELERYCQRVRDDIKEKAEHSMLAFFEKMSRAMLEPKLERLEAPAKLDVTVQFQGCADMRSKIFDSMMEYERAFSRQDSLPDSDFVNNYLNYLWEIGGDITSLKCTSADLGNYLQLAGNTIAMLLRIIAAGCASTLVAMPAAAALAAFAEVADKYCALMRVALAGLISKPCVNAFVFDTIALNGLAFKTVVEHDPAFDARALADEKPPEPDYRDGSSGVGRGREVMY